MESAGRGESGHYLHFKFNLWTGIPKGILNSASIDVDGVLHLVSSLSTIWRIGRHKGAATGRGAIRRRALLAKPRCPSPLAPTPGLLPDRIEGTSRSRSGRGAGAPGPRCGVR